MTRKCFENTVKILLSWRFRRKTAFAVSENPLYSQNDPIANYVGLLRGCLPGKGMYYAAPIGAFFCPEIRAFTGFGARFLQPFPKSLETVRYYSHTKNGR